MNRHRFALLRVGLVLTAAAVLTAGGGAARADIVTLGSDPQALANCPWNAIGLPGVCLVDRAAQVRDVVGDLSQVRIGRGGQGSLAIGSGATLIVDRTNLSTAPLIPSVPDVVVGDDVGSVASLRVSGGGLLGITVSPASPLQGGLLIGAFAAPQGYAGPSTTMTVADGGRVTVDKPGGLGVGSAVFVGVGAGSNSSLVMDGGIDGFGNQALRPRLDTTGNLSIGRLGTGSVDLVRHADVTANLVLMSTVRDNGVTGTAALTVGLDSTLTAQGILAGIALGAGPNGYDANSPNHGSAVIATRDSGFINAPIVLGSGGTLMGTGTVGPSVSSFGGTVRPGFSPGTLKIDGSYSDVAGHIEIEIGPDASDFIDVAGDLSLDGTSIEFRFVNGFAPDAGFSYDFIGVAGSVTLNDLSFSYSGLQPGFTFAVETDTQTGRFTFRALSDGSAVPEPSLPALLGVAAVAAWVTQRGRRQNACRPQHWCRRRCMIRPLRRPLTPRRSNSL